MVLRKSFIYPLVAAVLTFFIRNIVMGYTCVFIFHQPEMPDEIEDFR